MFSFPQRWWWYNHKSASSCRTGVNRDFLNVLDLHPSHSTNFSEFHWWPCSSHRHQSSEPAVLADFSPIHRWLPQLLWWRNYHRHGIDGFQAENKQIETWAIKKWPLPRADSSPGNTELVVTAQAQCLESKLQQLLADPQLNDLIVFFNLHWMMEAIMTCPQEKNDQWHRILFPGQCHQSFLGMAGRPWWGKKWNTVYCYLGNENNFFLKEFGHQFCAPADCETIVSL